MAMRVYVVRHGQSQANLEHRYAGWSHVPLSPLGREQAVAAGGWLQNKKIDRVYSSDLRRAEETCRLALPERDVVTTELLREVSVGTLSGRLTAECREEYGEAIVQHNRQQDFSAYGGESPAQVQERMDRFIAMLESLEDGAVAVFGHEGTLRCFLSHVMGLPVLIESLRIPNTCVAEFEYRDGRWKLYSWNSSAL